MNQYAVVMDRIEGINLGERIIVEGKNPLEALISRYPWLQITEVQRGEEFDIELIRIEIDSYGRTFLKPKERFYYRLSEESYNFIIENPTILLQMDLKIDNKNLVSV